MDENDFQEAIERNSDIIVATALIMVDLMISLHVIDWAMTVETTAPVAVNTSPFFNQKRLFIHYQTLKLGLILKSLILYLTTIAVAKRLPER